jgi:AcrR family transcriptional regulator
MSWNAEAEGCNSTQRCQSALASFPQAGRAHRESAPADVNNRVRVRLQVERPGRQALHAEVHGRDDQILFVDEARNGRRTGLAGASTGGGQSEHGLSPREYPRAAQPSAAQSQKHAVEPRDARAQKTDCDRSACHTGDRSAEHRQLHQYAEQTTESAPTAVPFDQPAERLPFGHRLASACALANFLGHSQQSTGSLRGSQQMPSTRTGLTKEEKTEEILDKAAERLRCGGYEGLSVVALAADIGVAQNTIYYYFPSKDHLFVGVLERLLRQIAARKHRDLGTEQRVLWFVDQFAEVAPYRAALYQRVEHSEVTAAFADRLDALLRRMLTNAFDELGLGNDTRLAVETFRSLVEGTYVQRLSPAERRRILRFALRRLAGRDGDG